MSVLSVWITAETAREEGGEQDRWLASAGTPKLCDFCHRDAPQALFLYLQGKDIMCLSLPPPETVIMSSAQVGGRPKEVGRHSTDTSFYSYLNLVSHMSSMSVNYNKKMENLKHFFFISLLPSKWGDIVRE